MKDYNISKLEFTSPRPIGVSGIMRVKNDAEFIEASIRSCIDALDELIIVYNNCSDNTPDIIKRMCELFPNKIKVFEYLPKIYSTGLTEEEYEFAKNLPADSQHLLANYYNYAVSKTSFRYILKIDADQIYFTDSLKMVLDAYRGSLKQKISYKDILSFIIIFIKLIINKVLPKNKIKFDYFKHFPRYRNCLLYLVEKFKIPLSLSGINAFYENTHGEWYVTLGKINNNLNILPPYNGVGDHLIFKFSPKTKYIPYIQESYNLMISSSYSIIEKFVGVKSALPFGLMWLHLNSMRISVYAKQLKNLVHDHKSFMPINKFTTISFKDLKDKIPSQLFPYRVKNIFEIIHDGSISEIDLEELKKFSFDETKGLFVKE